MQLLPEAEAALAETTSFAGPDEADDLPRPGRAELGESVFDLLAPDDLPDFVPLPQVAHAFKGARPKGLEGAIVHYDAGRSRPTKGPDNLEWGARNTLVWGQSQGYAYATVSRSGKIYLPGNMDWERWGSHAGQSLCPVTKRGSVSQFYVGFEVNSPGFVYPTANPKVYVPWFDAKRNANGSVILDAKGHATVANPNGELYAPASLRIVQSQTGNIRPGAYVPYTDQQFAALVNVMLWLKRSFPTTFRLDYVFGHDEVSPGRKIDPGGSLGTSDNKGAGPPMTMAHFRARLLKAWADQQMLVA
jgi:hypothetical protein